MHYLCCQTLWHLLQTHTGIHCADWTLHARLVLHNAAIWVQDAGSRNGVFVNETRVVRHRQLGPGDSLVIGVHGFTLELDAVMEPDSSVAMPAVEPEPEASGFTRMQIAIIIGISVFAAIIFSQFI